MNMREKIARAVDPAWWAHADALFNDHNATAEQRANYINNSALGLQSLASADAVLDALMEPDDRMIDVARFMEDQPIQLAYEAMIRAAREGK